MELVIRNKQVGNCPICDSEMEHLSDDINDSIHEDSYTCEACCLIVTYCTSANDDKEYHEYDEIEIVLENMLGCL